MAMIKYAQQLETVNPELYLSAIQLSDAQPLYDLVADPENNAYLARYESWAEGFTLADAQKQTAGVSAHMAEGGSVIMQYAAKRRTGEAETSRLIGCYSLFQHVGDSALLGYWHARAACGKGFATLGVKRLLEHAQEVWDLSEVILHIATDNTPSQAVARRLGAVPIDGGVEDKVNGRVYQRQLWRISF
jgi:RimJ/RimL family protein N-acetyltransferase